MIKKEEVYKIGVINKPHGIKGEVSFTFNDDIFDRVECDYLVLLLDGILVPVFIEEYRFRSDDVALVKFEGIETAEREQDEITSWNFFTGFQVEDIHHGCLGEIVAVDDSTMNVLFVIEKDGDELLLPAHEEFIIDLDRENRVLKVDIPDGLLE